MIWRYLKEGGKCWDDGGWRGGVLHFARCECCCSSVFRPKDVLAMHFYDKNNSSICAFDSHGLRFINNVCEQFEVLQLWPWLWS